MSKAASGTLVLNISARKNTLEEQVIFLRHVASAYQHRILSVIPRDTEDNTNED